MNHQSFALILIALLFFAACKQGNLKGFSKTDNGLLYKHHVKNNGAIPQVGDQVNYQMDFRNGDSIVASSREQGFPISLKMPEGMENNLLLQALSMMSAGDSLTMVRERDSIQMPLPPGYKAGDLVFIDIALLSIKNTDNLAAEKQTYLSAFTRSADGYFYKKHIENKGRNPKAGDGVAFDFSVKKGDLTVFSTSQNGQPTRYLFPEEKKDDDHHGHDHHGHDHGGSHNDNPMLEMLGNMAVGDSVTLVIEADSIGQQLNPEWTFQPGDLVTFEMKLQEIKTKTELEEEQKEYERNAAKIAKKTRKAITAYKNGRLEVTTTNSGLKYHILEEGTGETPANNEAVSVNYSGHLLDGKQFDNSFQRGQPFTFALGQGRVIPGWDEGLALLKKGTKAYLIIPANLAYGERGMLPDIPANSELVFYIELQDIIQSK